MRAAYPTMFYSQSWYEGEDFAQVPANAFLDTRWGRPLAPPKFESSPHLRGQALPPAVMVIAWMLRAPLHDTWSRYLWCSDVDAKGQRIYVGGVCAENGWKIEIHRHLALTERWGVCTWN